MLLACHTCSSCYYVIPTKLQISFSNRFCFLCFAASIYQLHNSVTLVSIVAMLGPYTLRITSCHACYSYKCIQWFKTSLVSQPFLKPFLKYRHTLSAFIPMSNTYMPDTSSTWVEHGFLYPVKSQQSKRLDMVATRSRYVDT